MKIVSPTQDPLLLLLSTTVPPVPLLLFSPTLAVPLPLPLEFPDPFGTAAAPNYSDGQI